MDPSRSVEKKLNQILCKLKTTGAVDSFLLKIVWGRKESIAKVNLVELCDSLSEWLRKFGSKQRRAEIRNVISELVKKKNVKDTSSETSIDLEEDSFGCYAESLENANPSASVVAEKRRGGKTNDAAAPKNSTRLNADESDGKRVKSFLCERCGESFTETSEWKRHRKAHEGNKNFDEFPVASGAKTRSKTGGKPDLKFSFSLKTFRKARDACRTEASSKSCAALNFECRYCRFSCESVKDLKNHMESDHKSEGEFICSFSRCGERFKCSRTLRKHAASIHFSEKNAFVCNLCSKSFFEKGKLNRHMFGHERGKFCCDSCSKTFARKDALQRHVAVAHTGSKPFSCSFCRNTFSLKYNRDVHEKNVHANGEEKTKTECDTCGLKCKNKTTLLTHKKLHSQKKVSCSFCKKTFSRKTNYHSHMKKKHGGVSAIQNLLDSVADDRD